MERRQREGYISRGSDYFRAAPPAPQTPNQTAPPSNPKHQLRSKPSPKKLFLIAGSLLAVLLIGILLFTISNKSPLPPAIAEQLTFAAYLPAETEDIVIDQTSYAWQDGVLTYLVQTPSQSKVFISQQLTPKEFDLTSFLQRIKGKQTLTNKYGQGQAGVSENNLVASQIIGETWIFMSGPRNIEPTELGLIFQSLQKY